MRERRYVRDTRVRHLSPRGPPPRHREYRDGGKYSREDERWRIGRRDGFDRELDLRGGRFCDTLDRERYGACPRRSRSPCRSDRERNHQAWRFSDALYRDRYAMGPRHSRSPQRVEKSEGFEGYLNRRAGRFSNNMDRERDGIGPRFSRSPRRIEKKDSFGVDPSPRFGRFLDAVDKGRYGVGSRHSRSPRRIDGSGGFGLDSNLQVRRFCDAVGRDTYGAGSWQSRNPNRLGERNAFEGDLSLKVGRFSETLDRDRFGVGTRRSRSLGRIEKGDNYDLDMNVQVARFSDYDNSDRGKYGVDVERSRRLYEEDLLCGDSNSSKFKKFDHLSDTPRISDSSNMKYNSYKNDNHGVGDDNITTSRGGGKREDYLKSQYLDESQIGMPSVSHHLATKTVFLENDKGRRFYSDPETLAHDNDNASGVTKSFLGAGDGSRHLSSALSRYLNTDTDKQGHFNVKNERQSENRDAEYRDQREHCFETTDEGLNFKDSLYLDKLGTERPVGREMFENKKENNLLLLRGHLKEDSSYMVSLSGLKDYIPISSGILYDHFPGHSIAGDNPLHSDGLPAGTGLVSDCFGFDGYNGRPRHMAPSELGCRSDDSESKSKLYVGVPEQKHKDNLYQEFVESTKPGDFEEEYGVQHMSRFGLLDSVDETSRLNHTEDYRVGEKHPSSLGQSTPNNFVAYGSQHPINQDLDMRGSGSLDLNFEREKYHGRGSIRVGDYNDEVHDGSWSLAERSNIFTTKDDPLLGTVYGSQRNGLDLADLRLFEPSHRRVGGKYPVGNMPYDHSGIRISSDGSGAYKIYNDLYARYDVDPARFLERPESSKRKVEESKREAREIAGNSFSSSRFITSHSSEPHTSGSRDIKKRLGPVRPRLHVSQRLMRKKKSSLKKQLAPAPSKKHGTLPWLKNRSSKKVSSMQDDSNGNHHDQGGEQLGDYFPLAVEPPEKSEDFKQLVNSAFFKFLKQINETPGKRKEYVEPGKDGSVKCIVCSSDSNEFVDTEKMAMHAFTSKKVGLRSQHLGFYRALCVLMGWKIVEEPDSDWHCEVMSNAETSTLKEDLIIWPPVMIVHNCSVDDKMADERVVVSTDALDAKLRGMGIRSILKVSNGKPGNQSVMIVKFNGTLSGLQEAERLHQLFVENKHGKSNLKQLKSSSKNGSSSGDTQVPPAAEEAFLYGYLGNVEDLDKLDSDTKKRCVIKSKKEILNIVRASVDTNAKNGSS